MYPRTAKLSDTAVLEKRSQGSEKWIPISTGSLLRK
jgi:hypothetical protein